MALLWPTSSWSKNETIQVFGKKEAGERERAAPFRMMLSLRFHSFFLLTFLSLVTTLTLAPREDLHLICLAGKSILKTHLLLVFYIFLYPWLLQHVPNKTIVANVLTYFFFSQTSSTIINSRRQRLWRVRDLEG